MIIKRYKFFSKEDENKDNRSEGKELAKNALGVAAGAGTAVLGGKYLNKFANKKADEYLDDFGLYNHISGKEEKDPVLQKLLKQGADSKISVGASKYYGNQSKGNKDAILTDPSNFHSLEKAHTLDEFRSKLKKGELISGNIKNITDDELNTLINEFDLKGKNFDLFKGSLDKKGSEKIAGLKRIYSDKVEDIFHKYGIKDNNLKKYIINSIESGYQKDSGNKGRIDLELSRGSATLAHELGHGYYTLDDKAGKIGKWAHKIHISDSKARGFAGGVGALSGFRAGLKQSEDEDYEEGFGSKAAGAISGALAYTPEMTREITASRKGMQFLKSAGANAAQLKNARRGLIGAAGGYAANSLVGVGIGIGTHAAGKALGRYYGNYKKKQAEEDEKYGNYLTNLQQ